MYLWKGVSQWLHFLSLQSLEKKSPLAEKERKGARVLGLINQMEPLAAVTTSSKREKNRGVKILWPLCLSLYYFYVSLFSVSLSLLILNV